MKLVRKVSRFGEPLSYDKHVYFVDFGRFGAPVHPTWFSMVRDPVEKFVSRFHYHRQMGRYLYDRASTELPFHEWMERDISGCVLGGDKECQIVQGAMMDLTIVS